MDIQAVYEMVENLRYQVDELMDKVERLYSKELSTSADIYLLDDEAGMRYRLRAHNTGGITAEDFDVDSMPAGWSWAGSPFVTPATVDFNNPSLLGVGWSSTGSERAFLYSSGSPANSSPGACAFVNSLTAGMYTGVRLDDGTDNNYVELSLALSSVSPNVYLLRGKYRTGGGSVTTTDSDTWNLPIPPIFYMSISGTKWSSWDVRPIMAVPFGASLITWKNTLVTGLTWSPTRKGLVFYDGGGTATWDRCVVDWHTVY